MSTLAIGGTGNVGAEVVKRLVELGEEVTIMTPARSPRHSAAARVAYGDLDDAASMRAAMSGVERLFLLLPQSPNEIARGLSAVEAARSAGVRHLVYLSVRMPPFAREVPHFASKQVIELAIREAGIPFTIVRPNNFFQNDLAFVDTILKYGIYPQPIGGVGVARVDVRDIADVVTIALTRPGHDGYTYEVNGPASLTGESIAATYARALRRPVRYAGDSLDAWSASVSQVLPDWLVHDLRLMYEQFQWHGMPSTPDDDRQLMYVLGRRPRTFDAFVSNLVRGASLRAEVA